MKLIGIALLALLAHHPKQHKPIVTVGMDAQGQVTGVMVDGERYEQQGTTTTTTGVPAIRDPAPASGVRQPTAPLITAAVWPALPITHAQTLVCGKYQHVDSPPLMCGDVVLLGDDGKLRSACYAPHCVDDIHYVTEREWQELMDRLKALENAAKP